MTTQLEIADHPTRDDLRVFLERLQRAGQPEVRLVTRGAALAVFGCTQAPAGLLDPVPVVLVMRVCALGGGAAAGAGAAAAATPQHEVDVTVSGRALLDRIARMGPLGRVLELPDVQVTAPWAGVLPPVAGWESAGSIDAASLLAVAEQGIARVAEALPTDPGEALVRQVRAAVWGAEVAPGVPAAAAFAAEAMGFLRAEATAKLSRTLTWTRLSTSRGHVLVRNFSG